MVIDFAYFGAKCPVCGEEQGQPVLEVIHGRSVSRMLACLSLCASKVAPHCRKSGLALSVEE